MFLSPQEYIDKLTDYSEENKTLNLIEAYFSTKCQRNVITRVGFGKGELVRSNHPYGHMPQRRDVPYILDLLGSSVAFLFPYNETEIYLTYWWFKHNIICRDQPWICVEN
ncbi:uncharacterized protein LOC142355206, partial [Convolutriloba macropyga]|uniref:uncharacterized protein LOC142355206 n=1 Tax=Convolutriloba macropyga TaxID=536237 RepID=UPI003F52463C